MCTDDDVEVFEERAYVLGNEQLGPRLYKLTLDVPQISAVIRPGQFVHVQLPDFEAHILRRPFSVYRVLPHSGAMEIIYQTVGEGTAHMTAYNPGLECSVMGPLGHGWQPCKGNMLLVGGGVGAAPLFLLAEQLTLQERAYEVVLGAQTESMLVTRADYASLLGRDPILATDDGSVGYAGYCTEPVRQELSRNTYSGVFCCGPEPLMKAVATICAEAGVDCWVSMERRMACGIGACLSCVVQTQRGKRRSCVDGPVFNARDVVW